VGRRKVTFKRITTLKYINLIETAYFFGAESRISDGIHKKDKVESKAARTEKLQALLFKSSFLSN